ncbi:MAG TPA: hypothetical protein VMM13_06730, partial [Euzebya sp.]|nr:hypothetical protein [Euzebya sp.]
MRVSALPTASLAIVLALSLLPAASAQDAASPSGDAAGVPSIALTTDDVGWSPGELDVDWAQFADQHRAEYESSSWATAAQDEEVSRDQLRADMVAEYTQATGTDPDAGYLDLGTSRTSALAQQYYDECDDGSNLPDGGVQASRAQLYRGGANSTG